MPLLLRAIAYICIGITAEILFTGLKPLARRDYTLPAHTTLWMFPVYGLLIPFAFEPLHFAVQGWNILLRGLVYATCILLVEYLAATLYICLLKKNPWEYVKGWHVHGKIRLDYFPFWMLFGLLIERLHTSFLHITL